jgi:hypothetical protein
MKKLLAIVCSTYMLFASGIVLAESDNQILLKSFHKYGITNCDKFIEKNSSLIGNWNFFISKHANEIDKSVKEASVIQIYGSHNDTIKTDDSYIQTKNQCFLHARSTVTYSGSCRDHVDLNFWYVSSSMPGKDYTQYTNKGGITMQVKEILVGNFNACIQETDRRISAPLG